MPRWARWTILGVALAVVAAAIYFPILRRRAGQLRAADNSETQARREIAQPKIASSTDIVVKAKLFWGSADNQAALAPVEISLPLSADPVLRSKQILNTLIAGPVDAELRTLPPGALLLEFYLLDDGTAIADFSEDLATELPSGIQSEQLAVDSIKRTLEANVPQVRQLKILIHGQEVETLAGHVDLTNSFLVRAEFHPVPPPAQGGKNPAAGAPTKLTPRAAPGKLDSPAKKP